MIETDLGTVSTSRLHHLVNRSSLSLINDRSHVDSLVKTVTQSQCRHSQLYTSNHVIVDRFLYQ